ncbi:MAG: hypothetical protein U9R73_01420 [Pseudomonadota bacterium]|nr:hypothetical protein [Pseudomonadota bacterium]
MKLVSDYTVPAGPDDVVIVELIAHARSRRADPASGHALLGAACIVMAQHYGATGAVDLIRNALTYLCKHVLLGRPLDEGGDNGIAG